MHNHIRYALLIISGLLAISCDDSSPTSGGSEPLFEPVHQYVEGTAWSLVDSMPLAGATAALVEGIPYRVVAGPVTTDARGHFEFHDPPTGDFYLFLFTGDHLMHDGNGADISVDEGDSVTIDVAMIPSALWNGEGPRAEGTVTDRATGKPVVGAFVSSLGFALHNPFMGIPLSAEGLTDSAGHYSVVLFNMTNPDGSLLGQQLGVSKEGYAPFYKLGFGVLRGDTIVTLDIALGPPVSSGTIRGRVVIDGRPATNVPVGIDFVGLPPSQARSEQPEFVPLLGKSTTSGPDGRFEITGLGAGSYTIQCAFLPDDAYVWLESSYQYPELSEGESLDLGDMEIAMAIEPLYPEPSSTVADPQPILRWKAHPGADYYRIYAGAGHFLNTDIVTGNNWQIPVALLPGTRIRWTVTAFKEAEPWDIELSSFDTPISFEVSDQPAQRPATR